MFDAFPWVDSPIIDRLLESFDLQPEEQELVKHYAEYGYVIIDPKIENFESLAHQIIRELSPIYADDNRPNWYSNKRRLQDAWYFNKNVGVRAIATAPKVLQVLRLLYQREPIPFQTLNFPIGTEQKTHSDTIHFHSIPQKFMCGVWVALEDVDEKNGPLHYYPRSHKLPILSLGDLGAKTYADYETCVGHLMIENGLERVSLNLKKGMALIWSANLFHGGNPILDRTRTRHSQVTHYFFSDCLYYAPLACDPFYDGFRVRGIMNIATGYPVSHFYKGKYYDVADLSSMNLIGFDAQTLSQYLDKPF